MKNKLKELYLLWWNDFLTLDGFTSYLNAKYPNNYIDNKKALRIINIGRELYNK
tara:strand:+ start:25 stop:186 length:162 start_codon:yes stop_codon:yes gene_type:complete